MARVLITGGSGFLGSVVAEKLAQHAEVVVAGDVADPQQKQENITYAKLDVTKPETVEKILRDNSIDTIVHLAAIMTPGINVEFEYQVDVVGTKNVLAAAVNTGVKRIIISSSGAAYGYHKDSPDWLTETDELRGNDSYSYSRHKRLVEEELATYRKIHPDLQQTIFRVGTILGPTVKNQITALWDGKRILKIMGKESPFVFIWVDDVAEIMAQAALRGPAGIFNVAGDGSMTVGEIAQSLGKKTKTVPAWLLKLVLAIGRPLKLTEHGPEKVRFLQYRPVLSNTKLKKEFGFAPHKTTREAFEAYVETHPHVKLD